MPQSVRSVTRMITRDHMSPFRGLMWEIKDVSDKEKAEAISVFFKENRDKKILMAVFYY